MGIDFGGFNSRKSEEWLDWLADDPPPEGARQQKVQPSAAQQPQVKPDAPGVQQAPARQAESGEQGREVHIHLSLPNVKLPEIKKPDIDLKKFRKPDIQLPSWATTMPPKAVLIGIGSVLGLVLLIGIVVAVWPEGKPDKPADSGTAKKVKADFPYLLPISEEAAASDPRYDAQKKVVSFQDKIGGVPITVSQQPLPEKFQTNTASEVQKLAEGFAANEKLDVPGGVAYLGTSAKGPQSVIYQKDKLLIFLQSSRAVENDAWVRYLSSLK